MTAAPFHSQQIPGRAAADVGIVDTPGSISGFHRLGFVVLVIYLFLIYSRIFEVKFAFLHIPGISYRLMLVLVVLSQSFITALKTNIGKAVLGFTVWFVLAVPSSVWKGGSVQLLTDAWIPSFVIFLATAGLIVNFAQCRRAVSAVTWAFFVLMLIAILWGSTEETGRLYLPHGKFSNPNEMGQALLLGLPLWGLVMLSGKLAPIKAFAACVIVAMLYTASKTGSRGALIGFGALLLCVFWRSSAGGKLQLVMGGAVLLMVIAGTMPRRLLNRYVTLKEEKGVVNYGEDQMDINAVTSTSARIELLRKSIKYTFQHPLFGVGPGMFVVAEDQDAKASGLRHGSWQGTHNSYTQVSSELGIPGFIFYVLIIFLSLKTTSRIYRKTRGDPRLQDIANIAVCLNYALIVYAVTVFFDFIAYTSMLSVFAGLAAALGRTVEAEIDRRTATAPAGGIRQFHRLPDQRPAHSSLQSAHGPY
jgi:O-antigen ligase